MRLMKYFFHHGAETHSNLGTFDNINIVISKMFSIKNSVIRLLKTQIISI